MSRRLKLHEWTDQPAAPRRSTHANRGISSNTSSVESTAAEQLLDLGRLVRFLVRHGATDEQVAQEIGISVRLCRLATTLVTASDCLKLRAIVEDWTALKIRTSLRSAAQIG